MKAKSKVDEIYCAYMTEVVALKHHRAGASLRRAGQSSRGRMKNPRDSAIAVQPPCKIIIKVADQIRFLNLFGTIN